MEYDVDDNEMISGFIYPLCNYDNIFLIDRLKSIIESRLWVFWGNLSHNAISLYNGLFCTLVMEVKFVRNLTFPKLLVTTLSSSDEHKLLASLDKWNITFNNC